MQGYLFIESFAGHAAATKAVMARFPSVQTAAFDIKYSKSMDTNSNGGMASLAFLSSAIFIPVCRLTFANVKGLDAYMPVSGKGNAVGYLEGAPKWLGSLDGSPMLNMGPVEQGVYWQM